MTAWIFDLDGVLVHLETHKVVEHEIIDFILKRLIIGEPIILISGRNVVWQRDNVLSLIKDKISQENINSSIILDNLYLSGEFGGTSISFEDGQEMHVVDNSLFLPQDLILEAEQITIPYAFDFIRDSKETIFTVFTHSIDIFSKKADELVDKYKQLLKKYYVDQEIEVHKDTTAINIKYKKANKRYATEKAISWLKRKKLFIEKFVAFGDSASDLEIGEELQSEKLPFEFVFVGFIEKLKNKPTFPLIQTV